MDTLSLYPEDTLVIVNGVERFVDSFGQIRKRRMTGRNDGVVFYSMSDLPAATPVANSLNLQLIEAGESGAYTALFEGSDIQNALGSTLTGTPLFRHTKFGTDVHLVDRLIWRTTHT